MARRARDPVALCTSYSLFPTPTAALTARGKQYDVPTYKRLTSHVSRSAICRGQGRDSRPDGKIREARQHAAAPLPGEEVHRGAVVPLLVSQLPYDQLRCRARRQRQHRPRRQGELAGGAKGVGPPLGQLHLQGQQRPAGARSGARLQGRQSGRHAAQHGVVAVDDGLHRVAHHVRHAEAGAAD